MRRNAKNLTETAVWLRRLADCADAQKVPPIAQRCRAAARLVEGETVNGTPEPVGAIHHPGVRQVVDRLIRVAVDAWSAGASGPAECLAAAAFYVGAGLDVEAES